MWFGNRNLDRGVIMKKSFKLATAFLIASYWLACSPKKFEKDPNVNKCQNFAEVCVNSNGRDYFDYSVKANGGLVDILFVSDNSGSMSFEQANMAQKFSSFLSELDSRSVDYRIGIITTDVSSAKTTSTKDDAVSSSTYNPPRAINKNGALQDGNLIEMKDSSGKALTFLTSTTANKESIFSQNIQREETRQCETFLKQYPNSQPPLEGIRQNCPSPDERGIFAANLFFDKNPSSFIRPNAHLAIVFLADEDVRSGLYATTTHAAFQLETNDEPSTLVNKVRSAYNGKTLSAHSIVVRPGDNSCLTSQSTQMGPAYLNPTHGVTFNQILGSEGNKYAEVTQLTGGILGDICANEYGSQLASIGANIVDRLTDITLACSNPSDLSVSLSPAQSVSWSVSGTTVRFDQAVNPGTQVRLKYSCATL